MLVVLDAKRMVSFITCIPNALDHRHVRGEDHFLVLFLQYHQRFTEQSEISGLTFASRNIRPIFSSLYDNREFNVTDHKGVVTSDCSAIASLLLLLEVSGFPSVYFLPLSLSEHQLWQINRGGLFHFPPTAFATRL